MSHDSKCSDVILSGHGRRCERDSKHQIATPSAYTALCVASRGTVRGRRLGRRLHSALLPRAVASAAPLTSDPCSFRRWQK